jgi:Nickel responsive protein SCO4226-like
MFNVSSATGHACRARFRQAASKTANKSEVVMKRYVIEREIPGVGSLRGAELKGAAQQSNAALAKLAGAAQWIQSYVADNKTFCVYLAESEAAVHEHAKLSGFPASKVTEISNIIDPMTAR